MGFGRFGRVRAPPAPAGLGCCGALRGRRPGAAFQCFSHGLPEGLAKRRRGGAPFGRGAVGMNGFGIARVVVLAIGACWLTLAIGLAACCLCRRTGVHARAVHYVFGHAYSRANGEDPDEEAAGMELAERQPAQDLRAGEVKGA